MHVCNFPCDSVLQMVAAHCHMIELQLNLPVQMTKAYKVSATCSDFLSVLQGKDYNPYSTRFCMTLGTSRSTHMHC